MQIKIMPKLHIKALEPINMTLHIEYNQKKQMINNSKEVENKICLNHTPSISDFVIDMLRSNIRAAINLNEAIMKKSF